jgi:monoamine oxidase
MMAPDVIVVGAGLAGAAAALKLAKAGKHVAVIEARDRCGGRGFVKSYAGDGPKLEFGGAWITPWHHRLRALAAAHGLSLRPRHPVTNRLWRRDGGMHTGGAASPGDVIAHERAIARVAADAMLLKMGHAANERAEALTGISFRDYLDRLECPKATRDLFSAWWTVSGNGDHARVAASEFLHSCSYDNGLAEGMIRFWTDTVVPGMGVLAERMIEAAGAKLVFSAPVTHVAQVDGGVEITAGAHTHRARACVLALGINQMKAIRFTPELGASKVPGHCAGPWRPLLQAVDQGGGRSCGNAGDGRRQRHRIRLRGAGG